MNEPPIPEEETSKTLLLGDQCPSKTGHAGREKVCDGCPGQAMCKQGGINPDKDAIALRMNAIAHKIVVLSGKGGVGKSSVASLLAFALGEQGKKVGLMDVDICGPSIPKLMNVENSQIINSPYGWVPIKHAIHDIRIMSIGFMLDTPNSPVVWRGPRKTTIINRFLKDTFWGRLDYLIVDTPPGTSDEHLSVATALADLHPDGCVIVTTPQEVALDTIRKELSLCEKLSLPVLGIIENMAGFVCPCCGEVSDIYGGEEQKVLKIALEYNIPYLGTIPLDPTLTHYAEKGECVFCCPEDKLSPGALAVSKIVSSLCAGH